MEDHHGYNHYATTEIYISILNHQPAYQHQKIQ